MTPTFEWAGASEWRHRRLRVCELSMSNENPPVIPVSIGDLYAPRSRSGLLVCSGSALASAMASFRVRGWPRKCKAAAIAEIGPTLVDAWPPTVSGCNPTTASSFTGFCTSAILPFACVLGTAYTSMPDLRARHITHLQYLL